MIALPFLLFLASAFVLCAAFGAGPLPSDTIVIVPHGAGVRDVASILDASNAIYNPFLFRLTAKLLQVNRLKVGEYQINPGASMVDILRMMEEGRGIMRQFTVAEGLTSHEVMRLLAATPTVGGDGLPVPPDGSLLPETYRYSYGDMRASIVARMQKAMQDAVNDAWAKRDPAVPLATPEQAVVMASVIEKETGKAAERPRIAGVFYNRLRFHMRLQSDPTVIYAITHGAVAMDHVLDHDDLAFASPYNTYASDGLPPHPICNPGKASLEAALHPETNDFLYFVADGTGGHAFARTLAEHNQNVTRWNGVRNR